MAARIAADPDILPGGRDNQRAYAGECFSVADRLVVRADVAESTPSLLATNPARGVIHILQPSQFRSFLFLPPLSTHAGTGNMLLPSSHDNSFAVWRSGTFAAASIESRHRLCINHTAVEESRSQLSIPSLRKMEETSKTTEQSRSIKRPSTARAPTPVSPSATDYLPERRSVVSLRRAEQACRGCELYRWATQAVAGEGPATARMVLVGEAPGDEEDKMGRPFVGPAGALLDQALEAAGINRKEVFVTNIVKHFKWEPRGKRRLHARPSSREIAACRPWLEAELELTRPRVIVCLGASAAQALLGRDFRVSQRRGEVVRGSLGNVVATYHPAAVLRAPDGDLRQQMKRALIDDLRVAAHVAGER
jgi:uracil-DNA glycosylase